MLRPALLLGLLTLTLAAAEPVLIDACLEPSAWHFHDGGEFPGAKGALTADPAGGLALAFDFSGGGSYVQAAHQGPFPPGTATVVATVTASAGCSVNWRLGDRSGRTFQGKGVALAAGESRALRFACAGPWDTAWGGKDGAVPGADIASIALLVSRDGDKGAATGSLRLQRLEVECAAPVAYPVALPPLDADLAGWRIRGRWLPQWGRPVFDGAAERSGGGDGELAVTLPRLGRDWSTRVALAGERVPLRFALPLAGGGNPHAIYRVGLAVSAGDLRAGREVELAGARSAAASLGQPRRSADLAPGAFGTCLHLSYGRSGAFRVWGDHERLLDAVAASGLTWIRDGVKVAKDDAGKLMVDPYDLGWLKLAKARGLKPIVVIDMEAKRSPEEFAAECVAVVTQLGDLATVFELGNEPNNFGGWVKTFGGTWNGKEKDGGTSPWVKAHLVNSNAGAEAIRKARPDATILALGACAPTNFRAMDIGLSPAIDGVVEHPYAFCMPAERMPYGHGTAERDGVKLGDEQGSFAAVIRSYQDKLAGLGRPRQVWITEFGWSCYVFDGGNEKGLYAGFSERAQAAYLARRWLLGLALGVPAACQYDLIDDYGSTPRQDEANFGLLRGDGSRKPSYAAAQHLTAIFNGQQPDPAAKIEVKAPLHRSVRRGALVQDWDGATFGADNDVHAFAFRDPRHDEVRTLALWSAQPVSDEFQPRWTEVRIAGWKAMAGAPLAVDLVSGAVYDVPCERDGDVLVLKLNLRDTPLALRFFAD